MLKEKKAVIFDLDGTLVDSMWVWKEIDIEYLGRLGFSVPSDLQAAIEGMGFTEVAVYFKERFQIKDSIDEIKSAWQKMAMDKYCHEVPLKPGVSQFLPYLNERGIRMAVASSNDRMLIEETLKSHDIFKYFDCIVTACEVNRGKPAPDVYLKAAEKLGVSPEQCLVFEDFEAGIQAGKSAGMRVCAVEDEYSVPRRKEKRAAADYYIEDYKQIIAGTYEE